MPSPPARDRSAYLPWFLVPFARLPLPGWAICLVIALFVTVLNVAMELVFEPTVSVRNVLLEALDPVGGVTTAALLLGYIPTFVWYLSLASQRKSRELRPLWRNSDAELDAIRAEQPTPTKRWYWLATLVGVLIATPFASWLSGIPLPSFLLEGWNHRRIFEYGLVLAIWTIFAQAASLFFVTQGSKFYERLSWNLDLLDLRSLAPFERERSTIALLWIVWITIMSLAMLDNIQRSIVIPIAILLFSTVWIGVMLFAPMRDVQRLISRLKRQELERVGAAISGDRSALADSRLAAQAETLSLTDLLTYRDTIMSVREWPVQSQTFLRVFLLLMIPLGSWIGGALVERILGSLLD
jgi:hypothetical protein